MAISKIPINEIPADKLDELIDNRVTEIRKKGMGSLIIERTPEKPVTRIKSYNIAEIQKKIAKIDTVIKLWEDKKAPLQAIIDEYESIE